MTNFQKAMGEDFLDDILSVYGNPREDVPVWDESLRMFICEGSAQAAVNHSCYRGVRLTRGLAVVERLGRFHGWTYLMGIELYALQEGKPRLVQKREYSKTFRKSDFVRDETQTMLNAYIVNDANEAEGRMTDCQRNTWTRQLLDACYEQPQWDVRKCIDNVLKASDECRH